VTKQQKQTLLVVDDEDAIREILRDELTAEGYVVLVAATGEEAMELFGRHKIDLALLDIRLPGVDGIEVLKFIQKRYPGTRAIMLTGHSDLKYAMEAREHGARDFIDKPFTTADVLGAVNEALKR
jgi:two-component system response regulator (stage 0 sporulation protein F)